MKPQLEELENRIVPSANLYGGLLAVIEYGPGVHTVSIDNVNTLGQIVVTEGDGSGFNNVVTSFSSALVTSDIVLGAENGNNIIQQNTNLPSLLLAGDRGDTIIGGSGVNTIIGGNGKDVLYSLLGTNTIVTGNGEDYVLTNFGANVFSDYQDTVVRFFGPGRTPGTPFIGFDTTLNDSVLYITPSNNGSLVILNSGFNDGDVIATYDLGDGNGLQTQYFSGVKFISYFGGSGNDFYLNNTGIGDRAISEAAYGGAGNDIVIGGTGEVSFLKGLSGNDVVVGRGEHNDISGNAGNDVLIDLGRHKDDVIRTDIVTAADFVFTLADYIHISP